MTLYKLAVRIDKEFESFKKFLDEKNVAGWGVREVVLGENEHWHFYVETLIKPASFRVLLKRAVPGMCGNGAYSVQDVKDVDKYLRYIAKGESDGVMPEIAWKGGLLWTDEKIEELHDDYWQENKRLKKRRVESVIDTVLDQCKADAIAWDDRTAIAELYIKELVARHKPINIYSVKSSVNLIQVKLCPNDSAIRDLAAQVHI